MELILGGVIGLLWGAFCGWINTRILKYGIEKNSNSAVMVANFVRMLVDIAALGSIFLLRKVLPFRYDAVMIGTAVALSVTSIVFAYRYGKK